MEFHDSFTSSSCAARYFLCFTFKPKQMYFVIKKEKNVKVWEMAFCFATLLVLETAQWLDFYRWFHASLGGVAVKLSADEFRQGGNWKTKQFSLLSQPPLVSSQSRNKRNFDLKLIFHFISLQQKLDKNFSNINLFAMISYVLLIIHEKAGKAQIAFPLSINFTRIKLLMSFTQKTIFYSKRQVINAKSRRMWW